MLTSKQYFQITGVILFIVGLAHLIRFINGWEIVVNGWSVPVWLSIVGVLAAWYLAYNAWVLSKKSKK